MVDALTQIDRPDTCISSQLPVSLPISLSLSHYFPPLLLLILQLKVRGRLGSNGGNVFGNVSAGKYSINYEKTIVNL